MQYASFCKVFIDINAAPYLAPVGRGRAKRG
jgi:hypothetical protein